MNRRLLPFALLLLLPGCIFPNPPKPPKPVCADKHPICSSTVTDGCWREDGNVCTWVEPASGRPATAVGNMSEGQLGGKFRIPMKGAIFCWPPDGADGTPATTINVDGVTLPYWWSGVSPELVKATKDHLGNTVLWRFGPEPASDACCGMEAVGGPLLEDGVTLNKPYWDRFHKAARKATEQDVMMMVSVLDGWRIKHTIWDRQRRAWCDSLNMYTCPKQAEAMTPKAQRFLKGTGTHLPWSPEQVDHLMDVPLTPTVKRWVGQVVYESCNYRNVFYEISNEADLTPGWTPEWERAMLNEIRTAQNQAGCGQVGHIVGSNSRDQEGLYDFMISHDPNARIDETFRPLVVNEYNPALDPLTFASRHCEFERQGSAFMYWRSDGTDEVQNQSLAGLDCSKPPVTAVCPLDPLPDLTKLAWWIDDKSRPSTVDWTPFIKGDHDHCVQVGMGTWETDGSWRWDCPMANEGDPRRVPCEQWALKGPHPTCRSDGNVIYVDTGFRTWIGDGWGGTWIECCDSNFEHCGRYVAK